MSELQQHDDTIERLFQEMELTSDQEYADRMVLKRMKAGTTTYQDYLYMVGRLNLNLDVVEA